MAFTWTLSHPGSVPPPPVGDLTVTLTLEEAGLRQAPFRVDAIVDVTTAGVDVNDCLVSLDFNDPTSFLAAPQTLFDEHRQGDRAIGPAATHVYETAHVLAPTVTATVIYREPDGTIRTGVVSVPVSGPIMDRNAYSAAETIVVDPDGDWGDFPSHDTANRVTGYLALIQRMTAVRLTLTKCRVLFRAGKVFDIPSLDNVFHQRFGNFAGNMHVHMTRWGEGAKPEFDLSDTYFGATGTGYMWYIFSNAPGSGYERRAVFDSIKFKGQWNPASEAYDVTGDEAMTAVALISNRCDVLFINCEDENLGFFVQGGSGTGHGSVAFWGHKKSSFKDFLLMGDGQGHFYSVTGCSIVQDMNALNGAENRHVVGKFQYGRNAHNGVRFEKCREAVVRANDIFSKHGWVIQNALAVDNAGLRMNTSCHAGGRYTVTGNHLATPISAERASGTAGMPVTPIIMAMNWIEMNPTQAACMSIGAGGLRMWSNFVRVAATTNTRVPYWSIIETVVHEHEETDAPRPGFDADSFFVYSNTVLLEALASRVDAGFSFVRRSLRDLMGTNLTPDAQNNVVISTTVPALDSGHGPFDVEALGTGHGYPGVARGFERRENFTLPAAVASGDSVTVPYWNDWFGNPLTAASFSGLNGTAPGGSGTKNAVTINGTRYDQPAGQISITVGAGGLTVTNLSGATWPPGTLHLHVDRGNNPMAFDTTYSYPPGSNTLRRPQVSGTATGSLVALVDLLGHPRPGHPDHASHGGSPAVGALEPVA